MAAERRASVSRRTAETSVEVDLRLDGRGAAEIATGLPFLDHMLRALTVHGRFDLAVAARGDLEVDAHHTTEDVAIVLGEAFAAALGERAGIHRFGDAAAPLDESLASAAVDLAGRGHATVTLPLAGRALGTLPASLIPHFLETFALRGGVTLHLSATGRDDHHMVEAAFKALALALRRACAPDPALAGAVPSTKGVL
ncbi:MAG: imidazoleglycerol-phosphate dehydratase HisB [Candidatus Dormibacteraceae bacterium]